MEDGFPSVVSLRHFRQRCGDGDNTALNLALAHDAVCTANMIKASLQKYGCVCIPVSDIDVIEGGDELLRHFYINAKRFFNLPEGQEPAYVKGEKQMVESFSCTKPLRPGSCGKLPRGEMLHSNLFPEPHIPGFGDTCSSIWAGLQDCVALPLLRALELILSLPPGFLVSKCQESDSVNLSLLRTLYYPPQDKHSPLCPPVVEPGCKRRTSMRRRRKSWTQSTVTSPVEVGISDHTDFEVVTVMHQNTPGLWLRSPGAEGRWYEMPFRQDVFTVILGDMVERWTAGWLKATRHRVVSPELGQAPRQSLVLFQAHDDDVRVKPLTYHQLQYSEVPSLGASEEPTREAGEENLRQSKRPRRSHGVMSFTDWVMHRPRSVLSRYPPVKQGTWVRQNELKAKKALLSG